MTNYRALNSTCPGPATAGTRWRQLGTASLALALSACATTQGASNPKDPWQGMNRAVYKFNDVVDRAVLKPVAQGYRFVMPEFARIGVRNFFSNLNDVTVTVNDVLQGKLRQGGQDAARFTLNTTVGLLGFVDVATRLGLEKHNEDFGQTLGKWGVGPGPYLVLPLLGPSTVRDTFGIIGDLPESPYVRFQHVSVEHRNEVRALDIVQTREGLLDTGSLLDDATVSGDTYNFVRDAWLQRRQNLVYDGNPPPDPDDSLDDDSGSDPGAAAKPATPPASTDKPATPASPDAPAAPAAKTGPGAMADPDDSAPGVAADPQVAAEPATVVPPESANPQAAAPEAVAPEAVAPEAAAASSGAVSTTVSGNLQLRAALQVNLAGDQPGN